MAEGLTENQIKRFAAQVGIRNPHEAERFVTGKLSAQKGKPSEQDHQRMSEIAVRLEVDKSPLSPEKRRLLKTIITFAQTVSLEFQDEMRQLMNDYQANTGSDAFTPEMERKMKEKGYDLPRFAIKDGESAQQFIEEIGASEWWDLRGNAVLLTYKLPPPISRCWNRSAANSNRGVEWAYFYRGITPVIQQNVKFAERESGLTFDRINRMGHHHPEYYYVWEVCEFQPQLASQPPST